MEKNDLLRFLYAIDQELAVHAAEGEVLELHMAGRSALVLRYGLNLATKDVDMVIQG